MKLVVISSKKKDVRPKIEICGKMAEKLMLGCYMDVKMDPDLEISVRIEQTRELYL